MGYKVYRSDDVGAPAGITTVDANLREKVVNILDACLVTGYGVKTPAGWTRPYADANNFSLFKSPAGHCVRVEPLVGGAGAQNPYRTPIVLYETDTGTVDFATRAPGNTTFIISSLGYVSSGELFSQTSTYSWIVYASSTSFAILLSQNIVNGSGMSYLLWSGSITNEETNISGIAQIGGATLSSTSYPTMSRWQTIDDYTSSLHNYKVPGEIYKSAYIQMGSLSSTNRPSNPRSGLASQGSSIFTENVVRYAPIRVLDRSTGVYVGTAEGMITLEHACSTFLNMGDTITINGKQYITCRFLPVASNTVSSGAVALTVGNQGFVLFELE